MLHVKRLRSSGTIPHGGHISHAPTWCKITKGMFDQCLYCHLKDIFFDCIDDRELIN